MSREDVKLGKAEQDSIDLISYAWDIDGDEGDHRDLSKTFKNLPD